MLEYHVTDDLFSKYHDKMKHLLVTVEECSQTEDPSERPRHHFRSYRTSSYATWLFAVFDRSLRANGVAGRRFPVDREPGRRPGQTWRR